MNNLNENCEGLLSICFCLNDSFIVCCYCAIAIAIASSLLLVVVAVVV